MQTSYADDVIFLAVVREDTNGDPADPDFAKTYADGKHFNFPATSDVGGNFAPFMADGYPTNLIVDLETMKYLYRSGGMMDSSQITAKLDQYLR